jgi:hypothetical protein
LQQLGPLYEKDEWSRLYHWLRWLFPYIQLQDHEEIEEYIYFWCEINKVRPLEDEFFQIMATLLPYSAEYYADYLLEKGHYKRWVDLQMMTDELPIYLDTYDLKKVESANPAYLLPLYHQAIEQCILKKSRDAYETAVTMLKKLKQLYKRLIISTSGKHTSLIR